MITFLNEDPGSLINLFPLICPVAPRAVIANSLVRQCAIIHESEWTKYRQIVGRSAMPIGYIYNTGYVTWVVMHQERQFPSAHDWEVSMASIERSVKKGSMFMLPMLETQNPKDWSERLLTSMIYLIKHAVVFVSANPKICNVRVLPRKRRLIVD